MSFSWRKIDNYLGTAYNAAVKTITLSGHAVDFQGVILADSSGVELISLPTSPAMVTFVVTRPSFINNTSTQVIASNAARKGGSYLVNNTSSTFYLNYAAAAVLSQGVFLDPGQVFIFNTIQEIRAIQNSGGTLNLDVFEAT